MFTKVLQSERPAVSWSFSYLSYIGVFWQSCFPKFLFKVKLGKPNIDTNVGTALGAHMVEPILWDVQQVPYNKKTKKYEKCTVTAWLNSDNCSQCKLVW